MDLDGVHDGGSDRRLRPSERLRQSADFRRVYEQGVSFPGRLLVLFLLTEPDTERKTGFVASRRVGNAVRRNRAKRLLREAFRNNKSIVPARGYRLVLVARRGCGEAPYREVERDYLEVLARAGFDAPPAP